MQTKRKEFLAKDINRDNLSFFLYTQNMAGLFSGIYGFQSIKETQKEDLGAKADRDLNKLLSDIWKIQQDVLIENKRVENEKLELLNEAN